MLAAQPNRFDDRVDRFEITVIFLRLALLHLCIGVNVHNELGSDAMLRQHPADDVLGIESRFA